MNLVILATALLSLNSAASDLRPDSYITYPDGAAVYHYHYLLDNESDATAEWVCHTVADQKFCFLVKATDPCIQPAPLSQLDRICLYLPARTPEEMWECTIAVKEFRADLMYAIEDQCRASL